MFFRQAGVALSSLRLVLRNDARFLSSAAADGSSKLPVRRVVKSPYSSFRSPTSAWKDRFRSQIHAQQQRNRRSAFVQQQFQEFQRKYPSVITQTGLTNRHFAPFPTPTTSTAIPAFSYLRARLQLRNNPHANARRNSLLRSRQRSQLLSDLARVRMRRRRSRSPRVHFNPPHDATARLKMASMHRMSYPKKSHVRATPRFSRRRQL